MTHRLKGALNIATDLEMTPQASAPTASQGLVYFDLAEQRLKVCNNGTTYEAIGFADTPMAQNGLNVIRMLQAATIIFSKNFNDGFADAYTTAAGRLSSVNTTPANTTAFWVTGNNEYGTSPLNQAPTDTSYNPSGFANIGNEVDNNFSTAAAYINPSYNTGGGAPYEFQIGRQWVGARTIGNVRVKADWSVTGNVQGTANGNYISIRTYNGSTWAEVARLVNNSSAGSFSISYDSTYALNASVQGIAIGFGSDPTSSSLQSITANLYEIQYGAVPTDSLIEHAIPSGSFPATVSKAIGIGMLSQIEAGASMRFKLQNATEDSGWINCYSYPKLTKFTAFTSQPTKCIVQLIPKSPNGTIGIPAIKGFWVYAE